MMDSEAGPSLRKKCQFLSVQKAEFKDEEQWISGEELRTDGSSDEENYFKSQRKLRRMRKSIDNEVDKTIQVPSIPRPSVSKASQEENFPTQARKASKSASTENVAGASESLDLENHWRPKRGSLKLPALCDVKPSKLNKKRKARQKVQELDLEIDQISKLYENEKFERLKVESEILENDRDILSFENCDNAFLDICQFQSEHNSQDGASNKSPLQKRCSLRKKYIQRNIQLAKNTSMASLALTDEEKEKLNVILAELENFTVDDAKNEDQKHDSPDENDFEDDFEANERLLNAYTLSEKDKERLNEIDLELQKYATETKKENIEPNPVRHSLEEIDSKLHDLHDIDDSEIDTLQQHNIVKEKPPLEDE